MLQAALEAEVAAYIEADKALTDEEGRRLVVRNGHQPERPVQTGAGQLKVKKPRVHDRREDQRFTSKILPPYNSASVHETLAKSGRFDPCALPAGRLHR